MRRVVGSANTYQWRLLWRSHARKSCVCVIIFFPKCHDAKKCLSWLDVWAVQSKDCADWTRWLIPDWVQSQAQPDSALNEAYFNVYTHEIRHVSQRNNAAPAIRSTAVNPVRYSKLGSTSLRVAASSMIARALRVMCVSGKASATR